MSLKPLQKIYEELAQMRNDIGDETLKKTLLQLTMHAIELENFQRRQHEQLQDVNQAITLIVDGQEKIVEMLRLTQQRLIG